MFYRSVVTCLYVNINNIKIFKSFFNHYSPFVCFFNQGTTFLYLYQLPSPNSKASELFDIIVFWLSSIQSSCLEITSLPSSGLCGCASSDRTDRCLTASANDPATVNWLWLLLNQNWTSAALWSSSSPVNVLVSVPHNRRVNTSPLHSSQQSGRDSVVVCLPTAATVDHSRVIITSAFSLVGKIFWLFYAFSAALFYMYSIVVVISTGQVLSLFLFTFCSTRRFLQYIVVLQYSVCLFFFSRDSC